ncbi:MAG: 1-deoxy-D-xylulose-5-phosphate synthase [Clostridia bacterium]|nr:1-deoxy-D-xylulose-5-phosphate synthase [Clostridia bacterium]
MSLLQQINSPSDLKKLSIDQLSEYAAEVKDYILRVSLKNGGHLASNLGVIDMTIALHYVFDCPKDKIIFDVGHQSYAHKIITGRRDRFESIRTEGGLSGFESMLESEYDAFSTGHASTSLSAGLGLARARDLSGDNYDVVSVIGDGALTGGMAYEALNDIGASKTRMIIVLNDNNMSISKNVGSVSRYLNRLRINARYNKLKGTLKRGIDGLPFIGPVTVKLAERIKTSLRLATTPNKMFEQFGVRYYGAYDGHSIFDMIRIFSELKKANEPVLVHLITNKGKGYAEAESDPERYHGIDGQNAGLAKKYSDDAADALISLAEKDEKVVVVSAAMLSGTGMKKFADVYPERTFDVGIAEEHAVTMAAGMAAGGLKPFVAIYSTFLQRGFDQIIHDVCNNSLPVVFLLDRAGINGADGVTHQGIYDISYLSMIPGMTVLTPSSGLELRKMIEYASTCSHPVALRYPKCYLNSSTINNGEAFNLKWSILRKSDSKTIILAAGSRMIDLAYKTTDTTIVNCSTIKPLDREFIKERIDSNSKVITLEDGIKKGGFGEAVRELLCELSIAPKMHILAFGDELRTELSSSASMKAAGLTVEELQKICS